MNYGSDRQHQKGGEVLNIMTIVLDGMPFIAHHLPVFESLKVPWHWVIAEGVANNVNCTKWCQAIGLRLSNDGTSQYLEAISRHPRITYLRKPLWPGGKVEMCNACLAQFDKGGALMQIDSDELWTPDQLTAIHSMIGAGYVDHAQFYCRYFLGPNIVTTGTNCYGNNPGEWARAWYFEPGMTFLKHEPPVLSAAPKKVAARDRTILHGLVFSHYAYYLESQLAFKEKFYGYANAVAQWKRLQANTVWPVRRLKDFLPWVDENAGADLLFK